MTAFHASADFWVSRCPQSAVPRCESCRHGSTVLVRPECECHPRFDVFLLDQCRKCQAYGEEGVVRAIDILEREIVRGMRLLGVSNVQQLVPEMVSCRRHETDIRRRDIADVRSSVQVEHVNWQPVLSRL